MLWKPQKLFLKLYRFTKCLKLGTTDQLERAGSDSLVFCAPAAARGIFDNVVQKVSSPCAVANVFSAWTSRRK